jgi:hypothetical protein
MIGSQEGWFSSREWDTFAIARQHEDDRRAAAKPEWDLPAPETPIGEELDGSNQDECAPE